MYLVSLLTMNITSLVITPELLRLITEIDEFKGGLAI